MSDKIKQNLIKPLVVGAVSYGVSMLTMPDLKGSSVFVLGMPFDFNLFMGLLGSGSSLITETALLYIPSYEGKTMTDALIKSSVHGLANVGVGYILGGFDDVYAKLFLNGVASEMGGSYVYENFVAPMSLSSDY